MDNYEGVRQPLDAKPPHLIADFKFHIDRVKNVFGVPKDELAVDWHHPDEPISPMWEAALPRIEGVEGQQVIIDSTPEGDNHYFNLWQEYQQSIKHLPITIGILSWGSHSTLRNTLQSYKDNGLFESVQEVIIFFQEVSETDLAIAEEFGITNIISSESNIGIGPAIVSLVEQARCPYVLFLEMDWKLIEPAHIVKAILNGAVNLIDQGVTDFYRLRSQANYGWPLFTTQFQGRELDSPEHLIEQVHFLGRSLADKFPDLIKYTDQFNTGTVYGDSRYCNYSNNPFICKKEFYLNHVAPADKGGISLEGEIRKVWQEAGHKVGYNTTGLFKHERLDR